MKVRKAIKKLVAIGTGAVMMGATIVGAMAAADLSNYPSPFIQKGQFDGLIVVGENAASSDVVGAIDIAISLQYGAKTTTTVSTGGSVGTTTLSGDSAMFEGGADMLELNEQLGTVKETYTETDLSALSGGIVSTDAGTTDYNQYLRFKSGTTSFPGRVLYSEDEDEAVSDYLYFADGSTIFEYELQFEEGLESDVVSGGLEDIKDETLVILGQKFNVVTTSISTTDNDIVLTMLGGDVTDTLMEGETKTYTIGGQDYEVKLLIVADTNSEAKFVVNGEVTDKLVEGGTDTLSDGTLIGIRDVMPNEGTEEEGGDIVEFYLGANKLEVTDLDYTDTTTWYSSGIEINDESIEDASIIVDVSELSTTKIEVNSIKYRLHADSPKGDVFIKEGQGLRAFLDEPEGMINENWDIMYLGLTKPDESTVEIKSNGDDQYYLYFTNLEGLDYKMPLADNSNNDGHNFKYGDNDDDLIFIEATNANGDNSFVNGGFWVTEDDYFVLGDNDDEDGAYTHVLRYESIDTSNREIQFTDLAGGQKELTYNTNVLSNSTATTAYGTLVVGGKSYTVWVGGNYTSGSTAYYPLAIDLDNSGTYGSAGEAKIAVDGGLIIDLGNFGNADFDGNDMDLVATQMTLNFKVESDKFDETTHGDENVYVNVTEESSNKVDISIYSATSNVTLRSLDDEDLSRGMTDFGAVYEITDTSSSTDAEDLKVVMPSKQKGAQVYVTFGSATTTSTSAGSSGTIDVTTVEKINVGAAKLDKEISDAWAQNLIIVGGPCANKVAADVMGVSAATCASGFEQGKALVKLYESKGKVALLVAGYSALDTRRAARVVSDYAKYADDLTGTEVVVSGTTLDDITVSQPTPKAAAVVEETTTEETTEETA